MQASTTIAMISVLIPWSRHIVPGRCMHECLACMESMATSQRDTHSISLKSDGSMRALDFRSPGRRARAAAPAPIRGLRANTQNYRGSTATGPTAAFSTLCMYISMITYVLQGQRERGRWHRRQRPGEPHTHAICNTQHITTCLCHQYLVRVCTSTITLYNS